MHYRTVAFLQMRYLVVVIYLFSLVVSVTCEQHLHANGPFGKRHSAIEAPSPTSCNRTIGTSSPAVALFTLNVTAIIYSSNEQINVTWTTSSNSCTDDFIGIYFTNIPLSTGTYTFNIFEIYIIFIFIFIFIY